MTEDNKMVIKLLFIAVCSIVSIQQGNCYSAQPPDNGEILLNALHQMDQSMRIKAHVRELSAQIAEISEIFDSPQELIDQLQLGLLNNEITAKTPSQNATPQPHNVEAATTNTPTAYTQHSKPTIPFTIPTGIPGILTNVSAGCLADFYMILNDAKTFQSLAGLNCTNANVTLEHICAAYRAAELSKVTYVFAMFDSFGKPGADLSDGNRFWLGDWHECRRIAVTEGRNSFKGQYCRANMRLTVVVNRYTSAVMQYGMCVPDSCDAMDLDYLVSYTLQTLSKNPTYGKITKEFQMEGAVCYPERSVLKDTKAVVTIVILVIWLTLLVFATAFDVLDHQPRLKRILRSQQAYETQKTFFGVNQNVEIAKPVTEAEYLKTAPMITKIMLALSVYSNFLKIMSTERRAGSLDCIHGIRFLSMAWVILGHTYFYQLSVLDNPMRVGELMKEPTIQTVANATYSVDTFFVISGLLLTYLWLAEVEKSKGKMLKSGYTWFLYYFHRYVRLTPVYMIVLGINVALFKYLGNGPLWHSDGVEPYNCKYWWRNLIYINNLFDTSEMCMGHSWYLSNDMQFHVFAPILLISLYFIPAASLIFSTLLILGSAAWRGYYFVHYNYMPSDDASLAQVYNRDADASFKNVYAAPWMRLGPYVWGLMIGYLLFKIKRKRIKISKVLNLALWAFNIAVMCAVVYGMYHWVVTLHRLPKAVQGLYGAVSRTVWAITVSWMVFACTTGNGGFIESFLGWPGFFPLSRLTYCAYLIHPYVMQLYYFGGERAIHFSSHYTMVYYFLAHIAITYAASLVFSLAFEATSMNIEKLFLQLFQPSKLTPHADAHKNVTNPQNTVPRPGNHGYDVDGSHGNGEIPENDGVSKDRKRKHPLDSNVTGKLEANGGLDNPNYADSAIAGSSQNSSGSRDDTDENNSNNRVERPIKM